MSTKYNKYAKMLEASFLEKRKEYAAAADALAKAEKNKEIAYAVVTEKYIGERAVKRARADAALTEAKANFDNVSRTVWADFDREKNRLTDELHAAIRADAVVNPDAIDANTVELLKAGVCSADDYAALFNRFDGNGTMIKLLTKHAEQAAHNATDDGERARLNVLCHNAKAADSAIEKAWDSLVYTANICSGQAHGRGERGYTQTMNNRFEELAGAMIEAF